MLLFNRLLIKQLIKNFYFNTSHVIIQHVEVLFDQYFLLMSVDRFLQIHQSLKSCGCHITAPDQIQITVI